MNWKQGAFFISVLSLMVAACSSIKRDVISIADEHHYHTGFYLIDPAKGRELINIQGDKYFTPASNIKILTLFSVLTTLGDSIPALRYIVSNSTLYVWGTGDPSFLNNVLPSSRVYQFLSEADSIILSLDNFKEDRFGPGWAWDDYNYSYSPERSAFPIYGNVIKFHLDSASKRVSTIPDVFLDSIHKSEEEDFRVIRNERDNKYDVAIGACESCDLYRPFITTPWITKVLLEDTLKVPVVLANLPVPDSALTFYSLPVDTVLQEMMQESDNFLAEQLLLQVAGVLSDTLKTDIAINTIHHHLKNFMPDSVIWVDGSGLSRYNLITPRSIVYLWKDIIDKIGAERLKTLISIGGVAGTIKNWYIRDNPFIYGKTGTLRNNHNLSGMLFTKSGKMLLFSYMNNNYPDNSADIKKEMEQVLTSIYEKY